MHARVMRAAFRASSIQCSACGTLGACPGAIIALLAQRSVLDIHTDDDVLYTTGPDVVTEVIQRARETSDLVVIDESEASRLFQHLTFSSWRSASS